MAGTIFWYMFVWGLTHHDVKSLANATVPMTNNDLFGSLVKNKLKLGSIPRKTSYWWNVLDYEIDFQVKC